MSWTSDAKLTGDKSAHAKPTDTAELPLIDIARAEAESSAGHRPALFSERFAERLPSWLGSIRVRRQNLNSCQYERLRLRLGLSSPRKRGPIFNWTRKNGFPLSRE